MSKAYDQVEWDYLKAVMAKMGFASKWINLIMKCVTSVIYSVVHSGHILGPITPFHGIRQGDPLSTYLFIICVEGFSALIKSYEADKIIQGCRVANGAPSITHMLFADDSYLFCQATSDTAGSMNILLHTFELASGQRVNATKFSIFFSLNTEIWSRSKSVLLLECPKLLMALSIWGYLISLEGKKRWDGKFFSRAGKEILLKTVIQSLPTYAMSVFLIPLGICQDIEKIMENFWWKTKSSNGQGIIWMSWDRMAAPKDSGGMGFRHLHDFNIAMMAKQGWRLLCSPSSLASQVYKAKYYPRTVFLNAELSNNLSFVWRSIWSAQHLVHLGARITIELGFQHTFSNNLGFLILSTPMSLLQDRVLMSTCYVVVEDCWSWTGDRTGDYTVKSAYSMMQLQKNTQPGVNNSGFWHKLWHLKIPPKVKNFMWRAVSDTPPTCLQLVTKYDDDVICRVVIICWALWKARNTLVWDKKASSSTQILTSAWVTLDHWRKAQDKTCLLSSSLLHDGSNIEQWTTPASNTVKINVDGAIFEKENAYGFGVVARDSNGQIINFIARYYHGTYTAEVVEALGVNEALSWLKGKGWSTIEVETDSLLTVQAIFSKQQMSFKIEWPILWLDALDSTLIGILEDNIMVDLHAILYSEC
ncbi:uncharacterized protein LOC133031197 [Cannabis sativa]|uniref:uncharacterized protein LOC133031197 n=1 Tax=Cannabis sativa TaxID=3483 RepID=UPI0029CA721A|nr:uncharacterized protein LOC133031197 [Cannabis sativa]